MFISMFDLYKMTEHNDADLGDELIMLTTGVAFVFISACISDVSGTNFISESVNFT